MTKLFKLAAAAFVALTVAGCLGGHSKQEFGTLVGAGGGAALGAKFGGGPGAAAGAILGAVFGNQIGAELDAEDRRHAYVAGQTAMVTGMPANWQNSGTGNSGTVTPTKDVRNDGKYCREYQTKVVVGGKTVEAYGTACRKPDGAWEIVSQQNTPSVVVVPIQLSDNHLHAPEHTHIGLGFTVRHGHITRGYRHNGHWRYGWNRHHHW